MLKLLHCADAHLDTPLSLPDLAKADVRRAELRGAFASLTLYARKNGVRLVLFSGDLFNNAFLTRDTLQLLQKEFAAAPDCHFVIAPGSHDCYSQDSVYARVRFPKNVHVFRSEALSCFRLDDIGVDVWGFANTESSVNRFCPLEGFRVQDKSRLNLLCGYAHLTDEAAFAAGGSENDTIPCVTKEQLARAGFDYAALGYEHNSTGIRRIGKTFFGYAGCLEGRSFDEPGYKGAFFGTLSEKEDGTPDFAVRRLRFSRRHYETASADVTGCRTPAAAAARILEQMKDALPDKDTALHLTLTGTVSAELLLTRETLQPYLPPVFLLEVCDGTERENDLDRLESDPTLRGAYYRELKPLLESSSENERETAILALRLGLQAMHPGE